jgi:folate-binding protein YgfZ
MPTNDIPTPGPTDQYEALTSAAGYVPFPQRTQIELTGTDRAQLLHNLCTNDILRLGPGEGCEAFVTSARGKVLGHVLVFCENGSLVVETVGGQADALIEHFDRYVLREDVELHDRSQQWAELLLAGPRAPQLCREITGQSPPELVCSHVTVSVFAASFAVRRVPMSRAPALLISSVPAAIDEMQAALRDRGATACQQAAFDQVRVEAGWPLYGRDCWEQNLPQEVNRDAATISFDKGCYLGQETVARIDALGHVNQKLVGLAFAEPDVSAEPVPLNVNGKTAGRTTSIIYSPFLRTALAMGYVRREHGDEGTQLESPRGPVRVVGLPL